MRVSHMGFSRFTMRFGKLSGLLRYDPADRSHPALTIDIDAGSIDDLTFHGVTKPVTLEVVFNGWGDDVIGRTAMGFSATGKIVRSHFGVKASEGLVGDTVDLAIETEFLKDGLFTRLLP